MQTERKHTALPPLEELQSSQREGVSSQRPVQYCSSASWALPERPHGTGAQRGMAGMGPSNAERVHAGTRPGMVHLLVSKHLTPDCEPVPLTTP